MKAIILFGLPGVGKHTVGRELEKLIGLPLLHNHEILDIVRKFIPRENHQSVEVARAYRTILFEGMAKAGMPGIITTIAGGSKGVKEWMEECAEVIEKNSGTIHFVELKCEMSEILKRIASAERKNHTKITTKEELDEFLKKDYFRGLPSHPALVIDNTDLSPNQAALRIKEMLA